MPPLFGYRASPAQQRRALLERRVVFVLKCLFYVFVCFYLIMAIVIRLSGLY